MSTTTSPINPLTYTPPESFIGQMLDPTNAVALTPATTLSAIQSTGRQNLAQIQAIFQTHVPILQDSPAPVAIAMTGSDARFERTGPVRNVELIVITDQGEPTEPHAAVASRIHTWITNNETTAEPERLFHADVEEKSFQQTDLMAQYTNPHSRKSTCIPTRALDAQFIAGDAAVFQKYKLQLRTEVCTTPKLCSSFKNEFLRPAKSTLTKELTGQSNRPTGVDVASGRLTSDGKYVRGPKYGMLRAIQYAVAGTMLRQSSQISEADFTSMPSSVSERIDFLSQKNLTTLTRSECKELKQHYAQALFWYAQLEQAAKAQGSASPSHPATISVDQELLKSTLARIQILVEKMTAC